MLGDLIYEAKGRVVGRRILAVETRIEVENTILLEGIIHGIVNITDVGTFITNTIIDDTIYYSQGRGIMTTQGGREMAKWTAQGIQVLNKENGKSLFRGSAFYHTNSKGKLAFLNNSMTVFESEVDNVGNILNKEWEWK
jgi:hypothetical protein